MYQPETAVVIGQVVGRRRRERVGLAACQRRRPRLDARVAFEAFPPLTPCAEMWLRVGEMAPQLLYCRYFGIWPALCGLVPPEEISRGRRFRRHFCPLFGRRLIIELGKLLRHRLHQHLRRYAVLARQIFDVTFGAIHVKRRGSVEP